MNNKVKLTFEDGSILEVEKGTEVKDVLKLINQNDQIIALRINGVCVATNFELVEDSYVKYIRVSDRIGRQIYIKGLKYVYILAVKELYGDNAIVNIKHSIDKSIYSEIKINKKVDASVVKAIKKKMKEIIASDMEIKHISVSRSDAIDYVNSLSESEKALNYKYMTNDSVTMYELGDIYNYFYFLMPASTKILSRFDLTYVSPNGIAISYPIENSLPTYTPSPLVMNAFATYEKKLLSMGVRYAGDINKIITDGKIADFIQTNEILYDQNMETLATKIVNNKHIKVVFISGPSSSGKTTTSKKLALYLKSKGKDTFVISTDDYFVERKDTPRKEDGSYEYEIIDAIDMKLFNSQLKSLLNGKEVVMPKYNFITGEKEYKSKPVSLKENQIIIVEGLHAINEKLNSSIDAKNKLKVYISPFTPIGLDRHNHISTIDIRFIRRMVRDYQHRGYSAEDTLNAWMGMRKSEEKYVYPYQRTADIIINTSLAYEVGVLRTYAEPLLYSINPESVYYEESIRILNFLKCFLNIPSEYVPQTSVLREFIGNGYFE